jgi:hypothetical protein
MHYSELEPGPLSERIHAVPGSHLGGVGLDLMPAGFAPND